MKNFFKKYKEIFKNIRTKTDKKISSRPTFENDYDVHIKTKIHKTKTRFCNNEVSRRDANYVCSSIIRIESMYFKLEKQK